MRTVILFLFNRNFSNNELEYKTKLDIIFKGKVPSNIKNCPSFTEKKLEEEIKLNFLTKEGISALKRILWVLKESYAYLEYSPMIVQIVSIFLLFMSEAEAFACIDSMVKLSHQDLKSQSLTLSGDDLEEFDLREMRWYFTFDSEQFLQFCLIFFEEIKAKHRGFKEILRHFTKLQFNYIKLFEEWIKNLYLLHLPLGVIIFL